MSSPHLIRPYTSRQLSLVEGDGRVVAFGVLGGRYAGPAVEVHALTLARRVRELPGEISTVVFFDDPVPDAATVALIDDMLASFAVRSTDVLARHAPVTEAVKRVERGAIAEGIDRATLVALRCPEVIDKAALRRAVELIGDRTWVNPATLVAEAGGRIQAYELHAGSAHRDTVDAATGRHQPPG